MNAETTHPSFDTQGKLNHLLTIEDLPKELLVSLLDRAKTYLNKSNQLKYNPKLQGKFIVNAFFENSTRTRCSFELAAKRLGASVLNFNVAQAATHKGESLLDTFQNLEAMQCDAFVIRHADKGTPALIAQHLTTTAKVINAGDGNHAHPSQALLDMFSIREHKGTFESLTVAIVGDILHSRVARSQIAALNTLNVGEIRVIAPSALLPQDLDTLGAHVHTELNTGLKNVDVLIALRLQHERMPANVRIDPTTFQQHFGIDEQRLKLAKPDVLVMHPGPVNRGVELTSTVADGPHSLILQQVTYGVAVRMAIFDWMLSS